MSKLCEGCPLRGEIAGDILATTKRGDITTTITKNWGFEHGTAGALVDVNGRISEILDFNVPPSEVSISALAKRIDACAEPTESTGFLNRLLRKGPTCSAIGHLAVNGNTAISPSVALSIRDVMRDDGIEARNIARYQSRKKRTYWFKA